MQCYCIDMARAVNTSGTGSRPPRTRRAEQAERTRRQIIDAATALFLDPGYPATTIDAIAARADVAVETVYSRFRNKSNLLTAILEPAIVGTDQDVALLDLPEAREIRACPDQHRQLRLMARFSRTVLQRTVPAHRILSTAAAIDAKAAELQRTDQQRRHEAQTVLIDMLLANGPLRDGLPRGRAADAYAALANPTTYAFFTRERGWTPEQYEHWLADMLATALLAQPPSSAPASG